MVTSCYKVHGLKELLNIYRTKARTYVAMEGGDKIVYI